MPSSSQPSTAQRPESDPTGDDRSVEANPHLLSDASRADGLAVDRATTDSVDSGTVLQGEFGQPNPSRVLDWGLMVFTLGPAMILVSLIAIGNFLVFRSMRRVFFRQERVGLHGRRFTLVKFRTLHDELGPDGQMLTDQERVTRFGRFLRNTHLDELPQLWNILTGDMSFLGPRPEMTSAFEWASGLIPEFPRRQAVRPGITGLAQITQGYTQLEEEHYRQKLAIDLHYVDSKSLVLDCRILIGTAIWMVRGKGWQWNDGTEEADDTDTEVTVPHSSQPEFGAGIAEGKAKPDSPIEQNKAA